MHGIIVLPLLTMVIIAWHKKARILLPVRLNLNHVSDHQELQGERFNCCEEGFRAPKKVQHAPGPSPKVDSAAVLGHHLYRACSGMAAGR